MQHSGRSYPVVCVIDSVNIRRKGGGTFGELAAAFAKEIIKSLPQNAATLQGGNHATPTGVAGAVGAGVSVHVGAVQRGEAGR